MDFNKSNYPSNNNKPTYSNSSSEDKSTAPLLEKSSNDDEPEIRSNSESIQQIFTQQLYQNSGDQLKKLDKKTTFEDNDDHSIFTSKFVKNEDNVPYCNDNNIEECKNLLRTEKHQLNEEQSHQKQYNDYINKIYMAVDDQEATAAAIFEDLDRKSIEKWMNSNNKLDKDLITTTPWNFVKKGNNILKNSNHQLSQSLSSTSNDTERPAVLHVQFVNHEEENSDLDLSSSKHRNNIDNISTQSSVSSSSTSSSSEDDGCSEYSETRAPDGGWGWVVVFASFMVNLIADGITFSFGVIFVEFLNYFGEGKSKTAWIGSLFMAIPLLSGPIASFLTDRYGCRKVTIIGSIMSCLGFVLSAFSNSMELLFLTFGVLAGFGLSLCYVAAVVIVAYYFEKKRSFATGLSVCGSGIGTFIFAPLTQFLLEQYGWRGTTLILAGVFLNMIIFGLLMRDLEWTTHKAKQKAKQRQHKKDALSAESFSFSNSTNTGGTITNCNQSSALTTDDIKSECMDDPRLFSSLVTLPTFLRNGEKVPPEVLELLSSHKNVHAILKNYPAIAHSRSFCEPYLIPETILDIANNINTLEPTTLIATENFKGTPVKMKISHSSRQNYFKSRQHVSASYFKDLRMHRHSLTYRGAMLNINRYRLRASSCPDIYRNSMTTIAKEKTYWYQGVDEFKNLCLDILDFSYFTDIRFLLFAISNFLLYTWYDVPYVYLTDYAIELQIEETDASMLIGIIGIVNMFGEIFLGWIGDVKGISAIVVYASCMALCGASTALIPFYKSYAWLCAVSGFFGLFIAANYALTSIILVELITIEKFTNAYGLLLLVQGIANLIGPPLAGWFYDVTGSYDISFYIAGAFIILSGCILLIVPGLGKFRKYRSLKLQNQQNQNILTINKGSDKINNTLAPKSCNGTTNIKDCFDKGILKETA